MTTDTMAFVALSYVQLQLNNERIRVVSKLESPFWQRWKKFVRAITFGKVKNANMHTTSTVGSTIYTAETYELLSDREKAEVLAFGLARSLQWKRSYYIGLVLLWVLPFPLFLAYGRYWLQRTAYAAAGRAIVFGRDFGTAAVLANVMAEQFALEMASVSSGWTWPFHKYCVTDIRKLILPPDSTK